MLKAVVTDTFVRNYRSLSSDLQDRVDGVIRRLLSNPNDATLSPQVADSRMDIWEVRFQLMWKLYYLIDRAKGICTLLDVQQGL